MSAEAAEHHGQVTFAGLPVPGAVIIATQGGKRSTTVSDEQGRYSFPDLVDGALQLDVEMSFFTPLRTRRLHAHRRQPQRTRAGVGDEDASARPGNRLKPRSFRRSLRPSSQTPLRQARMEVLRPRPRRRKICLNGRTSPRRPRTAFWSTAAAATRPPRSSPWTRPPAIRARGSKSLYTGGFGLAFSNAAFDARPFSLTGLDTPKSTYNRVTATATFGGPLRIPHLLPRGPNFFLVYQWTRNSTAATDFGLLPTDTQRAIAGAADPIARALLNFYPAANATGSANYNYQVPVLNAEHQDALQLRLEKGVGHRDQFNGGYSFESSRASNSNLFGFRDATDILGMDANVNWQHRLGHGLYTNAGYKFSRACAPSFRPSMRPIRSASARPRSPAAAPTSATPVRRP